MWSHWEIAILITLSDWTRFIHVISGAVDVEVILIVVAVEVILVVVESKMINEPNLT